MDKNQISQFQNLLIDWYNNGYRNLPWRKTSNPYFIWVSEIMLQQTQVIKVIPYYENFIKTFPTIEKLAEASLSQVLKCWEGMGYYSRARNLHKAAQIIVRDYGGALPSTYREIFKLPGIGPYTAAAILSIVFNQNYFVVDGNVTRVLSRIFEIWIDVKASKGEKYIKDIAEKLLAKEQAGTYNQAIMELGAIICRSTSPKCIKCPVSNFCLAYKNGTQEKLPLKKRKKDKPHYSIAVGIIRFRHFILIARRKTTKMLGGLWEFPGGKVEDGETLEQTVKREIKEELDVEVEVINLFHSLKHEYTHLSITLYAFCCAYISGEPKALECDEFRWVTLEELPHFAFPRANQKILEKLIKSSESSNIINK